jgi:Endoplasmic Reticulum-Golgi Intermediate Compartment (ERGIC)
MINFGMKGQFDITFPALQCSIISVDAMDISGLEHLDVVRTSSLIFFFLSENLAEAAKEFAFSFSHT